MSHTGAYIAAEIAGWPSKDRMAAILGDAGLRVVVGRYSIRVEDCTHFVFQDYEGDMGEPSVDADADSVEALLRDSKLVSDALARAAIRHRFEIYDHSRNLAGYLHHDWPAAGPP